MGKITKKPQEKHKLSLSPAVSEFVKKLTSVPLADLPSLFASWSQRWPYPRGDLMNWVEPLDRFDDVLSTFITRYALRRGPQTQPFGVSILLEGSPGVDEKRLKELGYGPEGDRELIESILDFSRLLVEKCANRAIYSSTDRLNDLLNTTSLSLLHVTLRLTIFLAQRYSERMSPSPIPLNKFYDYDHDRLRCLASPIGQPQASGRRGPPSPVRTTKGKDKFPSSARPRRASSTVNPNDFRSLCRESAVQNTTGKSAAAPERDWQSWAYVKVVWTTKDPETKPPVVEGLDSTASGPSSPTPLPRQASSTSTRENVVEASGTNGQPVRIATSGEASAIQSLEFTSADLAKTTIEQALSKCPEDMPSAARYELLHKLRIAYGLVSSVKSRRDLLAVRILAINAVANVFLEDELSRNLLGQDQGSLKPQELIQQLVNLIQDPKKGLAPIPLYLQTVSMETLGVLARHKVFATDINAALGANSSNGLLLRLTKRGLTDIATDNDATDNFEGDDWREAVFSMPRVVIEAAGHHGRSSESVISSSFITAYVAGLNVSTGKAVRVHLRMLDFVKTFFHHFKDGLQVLLGTSAFEIVSNLFRSLTEEAWQQFRAGHGIPADFKTRMTDYEIPYLYQQIIRSIIDMINDISGHQGPNADRVLRSLVDSQALLVPVTLIVDHLEAFGPYTWSEVVKALCNFLNNEPTSFTVISEAGIVNSFLSTITCQESPTPSAPGDQKIISSVPSRQIPGIPLSIEAIVNIAHLFEAICLTSAGFDVFKSSGALEKFFELFESPAHVNLMKDLENVRHLGQTFDELVRHHPNLRSGVISAVTVMLARIRHIGRSMAFDLGAGPKLWLDRAVDGSVISGGSEALRLEIVPPSRTDVLEQQARLRPITLPNGNILSFDDEKDALDTITSPQDQDKDGLSAPDYIKSAVAFLSTFFRTQSLCSTFLDVGGADIILDLVTLPSIPITEHAFAMPGFLDELAGVIHMMAEIKPHLVIPVLADRARYACNQLKYFTQCQPRNVQCYFAPLVVPSSDRSSVADQHNKSESEVEQNGTRLVKSLMAVHSLSQVLSEVFNSPIYSSRSSPTLFTQVNVADVFADLCRLLGGVSAACYHEEIVLQRVIRDPWLKATKPENFTTGYDDVDQILDVWESPSRPDDPGSSDSVERKAGSNAAENDNLAEDRKTAAFKNVKALRYLLIETPAAITEFFNNLGHGIVPRRKPETFGKQKTALVAHALAAAYVNQLRPYFLKASGGDEGLDKEAKFAYLVVALTNVRSSLYDDINTATPGDSCQTFVIDAFKKAGGVQCLVNIGIEVFNELKQCKVDKSMFSANAGLKICLDILDELTSPKTITESPQASSFKNTDPSKPFYFVPSQVLLELRMEALPLARLIWDSDYADQASQDVVGKLISILKHVLSGDHESEAVQFDKGHPTFPDFTPRKFNIDSQKVVALKEKGYDDDLAREALYRSNTHHNSGSSAAEEYCKAFAANLSRQRLSIPSSDAEVPATTRDTPVLSSPMPGQSFAPSGPIEAALAEVVNNLEDDEEMEDVTQSSLEDVSESALPPQPSASSAMHLSNILNKSEEAPEEQSDANAPAPPEQYSVESIDTQREEIRESLAERCNNVLNNHPNLAFELSDLLSSATKKMSSNETKSYWDQTSSLLVNSLLSMQTDEEITESRGKKIAAAAHLTALLIQDNDVFKTTLSVFQDSFEDLVSFLNVPANVNRKSDEPYPWVAPVLLILERMLSRDNEPAEISWTHPTDLDSCPQAVLTPTSVVNHSQKKQLFALLVDLLPRVGKDRAMALSIARVFVMLTRHREIAVMLGEKRNLQRLFLMIKQLGYGTSSRLLSSFMLILRHVVEDEETIRQIMRSEITAAFTGRNVGRQLDATSYTRELYHLVLRAPDIFIEVTTDKLKLASWQPNSPGPGLALKEPASEKLAETGPEESKQTTVNPTEDPSNEATKSVEVAEEGQSDGAKSKPNEIKPPVVEHPDGVIHFLLSELLSYKDVDDRESSAPNTGVPSSDAVADGAAQDSTDSGNGLVTAANGLIEANELLRAATRQLTGSLDVPDDSSDPGDTSDPSGVGKADKPKFKPEDHPIFVYRCFLLNCLVELLHSYTRTKIEFINFSRKSDPMAVTPSKPRSAILNYVLNGLVASGYVDKDEHSIHCKKRLAVSDWAIKVIVALCSKTGEKGLSGPAARYSSTPQIDDTDDEPELTFVRRFVLEHAIRAFKDASSSSESLQAKYSKLLCLSDMFNRLLTKPSVPDGSAGSHNTSYKILGRMMFDKNLISVLTSSLAEIDLSHPGAKRVVKFILRPLQDLTTIATQLSLTSPEAISSVLGNTSDDDISSASSVSEVDDEREETPDLYRNSALGMLDPTRPPESDSDGEDEDEDEEMYDEEDYGDEMDYEDDMPGGQEGDEAVSDDEDADGHVPPDGPIEGLPGDVPMEFEFVVNGGPGMEVDTDDQEEDDSDEDEDEDDEDEDEDDEEEDGEDFLIEGEDGEVTADNENDSLGEGREDEGDWEDEDEDGQDNEHQDQDQDEGNEVHFDHSEPGIIDATGRPVGLNPELNNLLRVLGHGEDFDVGVPDQLTHELIVPPAEPAEPTGADDEDDHEDEEDVDENDEMDYGGFDDLMDGGDDLLDDGWDYPRWDEAPPRRHAMFPRRQLATRTAVRSHPPGFLARRLGDPWRIAGDQFAPHVNTYSRMTARRSGRPEADDGTNPLLQRPNPASRPSGTRDEAAGLRRGFPPGLDALPSFAGMMQPIPMAGGTISTVIQGGDELGGHGAMLDAIIHALHRGDRGLLHAGHRININMSSPLGEFREVIHPGMTLTRHRHHHREDPPKAVNFSPATTTTRWQEEARLLFGNSYVEKVQRIQLLLMSVLVPDAQKQEKERRQKQQEELKAQREREEEERRKAEAEAAEAERLRKEEEARETAARAEEEARQRAEAEAAAVAAAEAEADQTENETVANPEPMEDVQPTEDPAQAPTSESGDAGPSTGEGTQAQPRVFTTIRGRQLDITGLAIDVEYLEALPEELREEVIMQQYATRREEAQQQGGGADAAGIDPEFLDALPEDIREEIRQQEAHAQRRREREAARRQATAAGAGQAQAGEMDNDDFLATLDPALRRAILAEQPVEILEQLAPRHAAEGREHARRLFHYTGLPTGRDLGTERNERLGQRDAKRQVVQLIDKAGVATLLRLMFLPQQGSLRSNLWHILRNVCGNRQTRFEVINMLLVILKEGSTDVTAVERSLASLSLRAKATSAQRTPQPLKRTLSMQPNAGLSEDVTPLVVVQQCLSALKQLSQHGFHVRTIFLREVDVNSNPKSRKGKAKEEKTTKYPINDLISLLDRKLIMESSSCLQSLSELLAAVTSPLVVLMRKDKEKEKPEESEKKPDEQTEIEGESSEQPQQPATESTEVQPTQDAPMTEAPPTAVEEATANTGTSADVQPTPTTGEQSTDIDKPAGEAEEPKAKKFEPPVIPARNLQLIVGIFVAQECSAETFHSTLETMSSISCIPGTSENFSRELINHIKSLSQSLCSDLDEFLPLLREAQNSTDLHGITSSKFSQSGSDQVKLLQVLKALDYLSESKKDGENGKSSTARSILTASYEGLSLGPLWSKLSESLTVIREKDNVIAFATILLPLIESLMVVCKNTSLKDTPLARQLREQAPTTPTTEEMDDLEKLFFNFTTEHRKILNDIIRQSPKLMQGNGSFSLLVQNPKVLDFDNKRAYFTKQIHSRLHQQRHVQPPLQLNVRRDQVFQDSYKALYFKSADEMKYGKLNIRFNGEEGVDAGGVTREWFQVLARGIFNPDWALWQPVASDRTTFHPNPLSWINGEHLVYFKFIGRIIGKALHEGRVLDCHFSRAVYKRMLGKQPNLKDLESMDLDYYKSLLWILENDITDIITEDFSVIEEQFGDEKVVDLIPDGRNVPVTEENKRDYVQKLVEYRLTTSVSEQLENFVRGFHDIIPAELVAIFDEQELELLISGLPEIDVDDWKANTEYHNYNANSPQVTWFWRIVRSMSNEERAKLLQFITGTSKVPLNGFKDLEGMQGTTRFSIHRDPSQNRLPTSHTCFNQLDLPAYDNQDTLKSNLMTAINLGADYFGFA